MSTDQLKDKPTTLDECFLSFKKEISIEEQTRFAELPKDKLSLLHHTFGQWIRNTWDLWKGGPLADHMKSLGFRHPDDMSGTIIKEYWLRLNNQPSEIAEDLKHYNKHWDNLNVK